MQEGSQSVAGVPPVVGPGVFPNSQRLAFVVRVACPFALGVP